jgi:hypothetical protein
MGSNIQITWVLQKHEVHRLSGEMLDCIPSSIMRAEESSVPKKIISYLMKLLDLLII